MPTTLCELGQDCGTPRKPISPRDGMASERNTKRVKTPWTSVIPAPIGEAGGWVRKRITRGGREVAPAWEANQLPQVPFTFCPRATAFSTASCLRGLTRICFPRNTTAPCHPLASPSTKATSGFGQRATKEPPYATWYGTIREGERFIQGDRPIHRHRPGRPLRPPHGVPQPIPACGTHFPQIPWTMCLDLNAERSSRRPYLPIKIYESMTNLPHGAA